MAKSFLLMYRPEVLDIINTLIIGTLQERTRNVSSPFQIHAGHDVLCMKKGRSELKAETKQCRACQ